MSEPIKPDHIIELQLQYLHAKASVGPLTDAECRSLEALIRCRLLLEKVQLPSDDPFQGIDASELRDRLV